MVIVVIGCTLKCVLRPLGECIVHLCHTEEAYNSDFMQATCNASSSLGLYLGTEELVAKCYAHNDSANMLMFSRYNVCPVCCHFTLRS